MSVAMSSTRLSGRGGVSCQVAIGRGIQQRAIGRQGDVVHIRRQCAIDSHVHEIDDRAGAHLPRHVGFRPVGRQYEIRGIGQAEGVFGGRAIAVQVVDEQGAGLRDAIHPLRIPGEGEHDGHRRRVGRHDRRRVVEIDNGDTGRLRQIRTPSRLGAGR
jgi:hypothetical protein